MMRISRIYAALLAVLAATVVSACEPPLSPPAVTPQPQAAENANVARAFRVLDALVVQYPAGAVSNLDAADQARRNALLALPPEWWAELERRAAPVAPKVIAAANTAAAAAGKP